MCDINKSLKQKESSESQNPSVIKQTPQIPKCIQQEKSTNANTTKIKVHFCQRKYNKEKEK